VPNGKTVDSEAYGYKRDWLVRLDNYLKREEQADRPLLLLGDYNIAPSDDDIAFPERWQNTVLTHKDVRDAWRRLVDGGLVDIVRSKNEPPGPYSWWDYRRLAFPKGDGIRIDHILGTPDMRDKCIEAWVDRDERKGAKPSDHAPVMARFED